MSGVGTVFRQLDWAIMHGNRLQVIGGFSIVPPPAPTILSVQLHTTPLFCVLSVVDIDLVPAEDGDVILVGELT